MFCSKCGKQIEDGSRFCPYCGNVQGQDAGQSSHLGYSANKNMYNSGNQGGGLLMGMSAVDIIIAALYIILALWWTVQFFSNLKGSWTTYEFLGTDAKFIGMILYIIPYALILCLSIIGALGVRKQEYHISTGVIIGGVGLILKIGSAIFDSASYKSYVIVAQRVLFVYGAIGISTLILGIVIAVLLYAKLNQAG